MTATRDPEVRATFTGVLGTGVIFLILVVLIVLGLAFKEDSNRKEITMCLNSFESQVTDRERVETCYKNTPLNIPKDFFIDGKLTFSDNTIREVMQEYVKEETK